MKKKKKKNQNKTTKKSLGKACTTAPSPLSWYGAKAKYAYKIVKLFPPHQTYVEPFLGGGAVFFAKHPSPVEILNDLHSHLVNFFRVLRDRKQRGQLIEQVDGTPWSLEEFTACIDLLNDGRWKNNVERAWAFFVSTKQGRNGVGRYAADWSYARTQSRGDISARTSMWMNLPRRLAVAGLRLKGAQIEHRSALNIIDRYDGDNVLMYLDPPYLLETRCQHNTDMYKHEMSKADHARLLLRLKEAKAMIVLSGYPSDLYDVLLAGWTRIEIEGYSSASPRVSKHLKKRTEVLWLNYPPPMAAETVIAA